MPGHYGSLLMCWSGINGRLRCCEPLVGFFLYGSLEQCVQVHCHRVRGVRQQVDAVRGKRRQILVLQKDERVVGFERLDDANCQATFDAGQYRMSVGTFQQDTVRDAFGFQCLERCLPVWTAL